ncbi:SH3 domain-containing protein [Flavobacterium sp. KJJ]|uniref:SH3 domain-containing protein n=1 Tax=Flavobacterium sp. KJJ TaxID=1270193 RepID=UPI000492F61D|nr:SH3 domain-containing protein [Flavobacterium sp. KJJ]
MNKYFIIFLLIATCNINAQNNFNGKQLQEGYNTKNKKKFIDNFPNDFEDFKLVFGWNDKLDKPNALYSEANDFIRYFFELSSNNDNCRKTIIKIACQAKWEADAVNYFHMNLVLLVENNKNFDNMLQTLDDKDLNDFWHFYFDIENLIYSKKLYTILNDFMKEKSMSVFNILKKERSNGNKHRKLYTYQIFDKDGYCNLRKYGNAKSDIIGKIENNQEINVLDSSEDWWFIQTKEGIAGFVHKSRIK